MSYEEKLEEDAIEVAAPEREISLGTSTILGIFLGLALLCAICFGLGYSMGHRSSGAAAASIPVVAPAPKYDSTFSSFKQPAAASTATQPAAAPEPAAANEELRAKSTTETPASASAPNSTAAQPATSSAGAWMVQVSLSSVKPDAEKLTGVLIKQGFSASMREDKDHRFHIRVGPFASKADAETTRKMLVAAGYKEPFISNH